MRIARYDAKRDGNEREIIQALEKRGAVVVQLDVVDLLVYFRGAISLLEVKTKRGRLTPAQKKFREKVPFFVVRNIPEAIAAMHGSDIIGFISPDASIRPRNDERAFWSSQPRKTEKTRHKSTLDATERATSCSLLEIKTKGAP